MTKATNHAATQPGDTNHLRRQAIEAEAAEALLDRGVSVSLGRLRLPFKKKPIALRATMRRPRLGGLIRLARVYLSMGVTQESMAKFTKEEEMDFLARHGKEVSRMIALTLCRGWWSRHLLLRPAAWWVRNFMEPAHMRAAMARFVLLLGTAPFMTIISSVERMNPMKPRLSQTEKGSQRRPGSRPIAPSDSPGR